MLLSLFNDVPEVMMNQDMRITQASPGAGFFGDRVHAIVGRSFFLHSSLWLLMRIR